MLAMLCEVLGCMFDFPSLGSLYDVELAPHALFFIFGIVHEVLAVQIKTVLIAILI